MIGFSLVVCRNKEGKYLGVKETENRGWWLPGGKVDPPETFFQAALREVKEEAGIDVELKGILRVEYYIEEIDCQRIKLIFYAEPKDGDQVPKNFADNESEEARWLTLSQIKELEGEGPGWRGPELHDWAKYLEDGGKVFPLGLLSEEGSEVKLL